VRWLLRNHGEESSKHSHVSKNEKQEIGNHSQILHPLRGFRMTIKYKEIVKKYVNLTQQLIHSLRERGHRSKADAFAVCSISD
jgi:hypothetical protein